MKADKLGAGISTNLQGEPFQQDSEPYLSSMTWAKVAFHQIGKNNVFIGNRLMSKFQFNWIERNEKTEPGFNLDAISKFGRNWVEIRFRFCFGISPFPIELKL